MPMTATAVRREADMTADSVKFRGRGVSATATAGTSTNIDLQITEERLIDGMIVRLKNHAWGDYSDFKVVDVDNILGYGAGTVLDTFGTSWYWDDDVKSQEMIRLPYSAFILAGLYVRFVYVSTGATNVDVKVNYFLHKPLI